MAITSRLPRASYEKSLTPPSLHEYDMLEFDHKVSAYSMKQALIITCSLILGALAGAFAATVIVRGSPSPQQLIADYYSTENLVHVSPHSLRKKMDQGDESFVLVDLRSAEEYENEHIIGAVSIPAYRDKDHSAYDQVDRIVASFEALPKNKEIITYCYSIPCMTSRKVGDMLAQRGIYTKHLNIGWNEWRYFWNLWNHEHEWKITDVQEYVAKGKEPGTPKVKRESIEGCTAGGLGC